MGKIKELDKEVYMKIAAGEVVERPLSVVKELVENSIDSGADLIEIELKGAGKSEILIRDNGCGFDPEDIPIAFKRHSTSKLRDIEDFNSLDTLGFRGEALPSVLEVSEIELRTCHNDSGEGVFTVFNNREIEQREKIPFSRGSEIRVKNLFYNFPVRRKFLKSDRTEFSKILRLTEQLALANPDISFVLKNNGKTSIDYKSVKTLKERIYQVFGGDFTDRLIPVDSQSEGVRIYGFISGLNKGVTQKKHQYFFVNRRGVRESTLIAALNNSFSKYIEKHTSPASVLFVEIDPSEIDVNIHPMKLEIKFVDSGKMYKAVKSCVDSGFEEESYKPDILNGSFVNDSGGFDISESGSSENESYNKWEFIKDEEQSIPENVSERRELFNMENRVLFKEERENLCTVLGQFHESYIIVEKDSELLVVDQHNAHERVNFDKLKSAFQEKNVMTRSPLFPVIVELTPSEAALLSEEKCEMFEKYGFRLEFLGKNSIDIKHFPALLSDTSVKGAFYNILNKKDSGEIAIEDQILASIACKASIKVNHRLTRPEMEKLADDLFSTSNPWFCPHKRPIIIRMSLFEIEKKLKRR